MAGYGWNTQNERWVFARNGQVPSGAFAAGRDLDSVLYVARVTHKGDIVPGKLNPAHRKCYIPWGGQEIPFQEYEVLCGSNYEWVSSAGGNVAPRAVPSTRGQGREIMYIGRVHHNGTATVGKVHPSHGVCYIPFGGQELSFPNYEILVASSRTPFWGGMPSNNHLRVEQTLQQCCFGYPSSGSFSQTYPASMALPVLPLTDFIYPSPNLEIADTCMPKPPRRHAVARVKFARKSAKPVSYPAFKQVAKHETWVMATHGNLPPGCYAGGHDHDSELYVGRAHYNGDLVPGKVNCLHKVCYIPWGGNEIRIGSYEVLQGDHLEWTCSQGGRIPEGAVHGGRTRQGEVLYIGRVHHNGTRTIGKVQASHGVCYIPYDGKELGFPNYEVLVKRNASNNTIYEHTDEKCVIQSVTWVEARNGSIPSMAFSGGRSHGYNFYIGRAHHGDDLIPGKVHGDCFYSWNGLEHRKDEYQVLCGRNLSWTSSSGGKIPNNAVHGGHTGNGEVLFIGRVHHHGHPTIGKVHPSHGVCYIPYGGREIAHQNYDILISNS